MSRATLTQSFIRYMLKYLNNLNLQTPNNITSDIQAALSPARMSTYEMTVGDTPSALALYAWNANISGTLLIPLHICEVVVRNAVSDALINIYGSNWPWNTTFECSLPNNRFGYKPRKDLQDAKKNMTTTGKVIPELKFIFWQKMFTQRYDVRIWNKNLLHVMPNLDRTKSIHDLRENIYNTLENIRILRNRIAHHEPIFNRNIEDDYKKILEIINYRCANTANWMHRNQLVTSYIKIKP